MTRISKSVDIAHKIHSKESPTIQQRAAAYLAQCRLLLARMNDPEADAICAELLPYVRLTENIQLKHHAFQPMGDLLLMPAAGRA